MLAHADDASVRDGPVELAQFIVPLWKDLPVSRLPAVVLCLLDEIARPVLGAAKQLLLLALFEQLLLLLLAFFEPSNRYHFGFVCECTAFSIYDLLCSMLDD